MRIRRIIKTTLIVAIAVISCIFAFIGYSFYIVKLRTIQTDKTEYLYITPNDNSATVAEKISDITGGSSTKGFELLARHNKFDSRKRSGRFAINNGDNMHAIYRRIVSNEQVPVKLVVPSTRTLEQLTGAISRQLMLDSLELSKFLTNPIYYKTIGYKEETLPALFIPNTYEVYWNIKPENLMTRLMKERRNFWNKERIAKAEKLNMTPEEVATLASIIDEETNSDEEKPIVAGMYINRLKRDMPLQADPTVKFAIGDPTRKRILKKDLETDSPYNTYRYKGLPPGPLRIPTIQAIESVLNYTKHNYLYMCAKEDFSGRHNFAKTLSEHNANARRYQQALNKLNIKR
ncbi:MAG: endolytic transglycosylase MltG [Bacteroidaceae bacterium]|nr:endolytic transglycosylase MltG [Bacteroidaceae bacterium]